MSTKNSKANCTTCSRSFPNVHGLAQHIRDSSQDHHHCFDCDRSFHSKAALDQHLNSPNHSSSSKAQKTSSTGNNQPPRQAPKALPNNQLALGPPQSKECSCFDCGRRYFDKSALHTHRGGSGPGVKCPNPCNKTVQARNKNSDLLCCEFCNGSFTEGAIQNHYRTVHRTCFDCDRRFVDRNALENHKASKKCYGKQTRSTNTNASSNNNNNSNSNSNNNSNSNSFSSSCEFCNTAFVVEGSLIKHIKTTHGYCDACHRHFADKRGLGKHKDSGSCNPRAAPSGGSKTTASVSCELCGPRSAFTTKRDLENHINVAHVRCSSCSKLFVDKRAFGAHKAGGCGSVRPNRSSTSVPANARIQCQFCATPLTSKNDLDTHLKFSHARCFDCGLHLTDKRALTQHKTGCHSARNVINSNSNSNSNSNNNNNNNNNNSKSNKNNNKNNTNNSRGPQNKTTAVAAGVKCAFCSSTFTSGGALDAHVSAAHATCSDCSRHFPDKVELGHHLLAGKCSKPSSSDNSALLHCAFCNASFASVNALGTHIRGSHSYCEDCDRDFADKTTLGRHLAEGKCDRKKTGKKEVTAAVGDLIETLRGLNL